MTRQQATEISKEPIGFDEPELNEALAFWNSRALTASGGMQEAARTRRNRIASVLAFIKHPQ